MASLFDMDYGTVRKGTERLSGREAPRATPSLWDYINAVSMTPVPGVSDVAAGLLAAKDFREGNYGASALNAAGVLPFVPAMGGIFKGVKGATKAEKQALLKAQQMAREGADRDTIWNATLWYKGKDGKWRTEIDDSGARVTPKVDTIESARDPNNYLHNAPIEQVIQHEDLFNAYPELRDLKSTVTYSAKGRGGEFTGDTAVVTTGGAPGDARSVALHELQHPIQQREGMARGGSPGAISREVGEARYIADEISQKLQRLENQAGAEADLWLAEYPERVKEAIDYMKAQDLFDPNVSLREQVKFAIFDQDRTYKSLTEEWRKATQMMRQSPTETYRSLLGEVDARNTQARMDMTLDQRRQFAPWTTWDVPEADQIVRMEGGPAMSIADTSMDDLAAQLEAMRAANKAKGLPVETGTGDLRNEIARRNAVGLLGLPETNTAADRARAMGFTGDVFHGSQTTTEWAQNPYLMRMIMEGQDIPAGAASSNDAITEFRTRPGGLKMFDFAVHAGTPEAAADRLRTYHGIKSAEKYAPQLADAYVMPLLINESKPLFDAAKSEGAVQNALARRAEKLGFNKADTRHYSSVYPTPANMKKAQKAVANQLKEEGITNIPYINSHEARGSISQAILDPRNIRSRFAAFDPARRDEADLLAGLLPYAIPAGLLGMFLTRPGEGYE